MAEIKVKIKKESSFLKSQNTFKKKKMVSPQTIWLITIIIFFLIFFIWLRALLKIELKKIGREDQLLKILFQSFNEVKKDSQETIQKFKAVFKQKRNLTPEEIEKMKEKILNISNEQL